MISRGACPGFFDAVLFTGGDEGELVLREKDGLPAQRNRGDAPHYDPVFRAVAVHLQAGHRSGVDEHAVHLDPIALSQGIIPPPGAKDLAMGGPFPTFLRFEGGNDFFDVLDLIHIRDKNRIRGFNHSQQIDADTGNQTRGGNHERVLGIFEEHIPGCGVAFFIFFADAPDGVPRADVGPPRIQSDHDAADGWIGQGAEIFHDGIIDGIGGTFGEGFGIQTMEIQVAPPPEKGGAAGGQHGRLKLLHRFEPRFGPHEKHAAVPAVVAGGQIGFRRREIRLLDETEYRERLLGKGRFLIRLDVSISRFRPVRNDAEGDDGPGKGRSDALFSTAW